MNILQVIPYFPPVKTKGGPPEAALYRSKNLNELGHQVTVFTTDWYSPSERYAGQEEFNIDNDISVYRFKNVSHRLATYGIDTPINMLNELRKKKNEFDIIHLEAMRHIDSAFVRWFSNYSETPYVIKPGGSVPRIGKEQLKYVFDVVEGKKIMRDAASVHAVSSIESKQFQETFPNLSMDKVTHLPNGVDISKYRPDSVQKGKFKEKYKIEEENILLFLSRLNEIKRPGMLLESYNEIINELESTKLVFVGPDEGESHQLRSECKKYGISDKVLFTGPLYNERKLEAFVDSDVFILPSRYDAFPVVVLEAMACKLPVIISRSTGAIEYVDDACLSFSNKKELKNEIKRIIKEDDLRLKLSQDGYEYVIENLTWYSVAQDIENMYKKAIENYN